MADDRLRALVGFFREIASKGERGAEGAVLQTYATCPGCGARVERWVELDPMRHRPGCMLIEALQIVQWRYTAPDATAQERPVETMEERKEWLGLY